MKHLALIALVLLGTVCLVSAGDASKVVDLDDKNFDSFIAGSPLTLVEFFAPWCGHCKALAPEYDKASLELEGKNAGSLAKVDCTLHRELCDRFKVRGFPTLKLFRDDGSDPTDYDSGRKADAIVKFMVKQNSPAVQTLDSLDAVNSFSSKDAVRVVAIVNSGDSLDAFTKVANSLRNEYSFGAVLGKDDVAAHFKVTAPGVVLLRNFDDGNVVYTKAFNGENFEEELTTFVNAYSFPLVGEIGPENYMKYVDRGFNMVWFFIDLKNSDHGKIVDDIATVVAKEFRDKLSFVKLDGVRWAEHGKSLGLNGETPGVVIEDRSGRKNYVFPQDQSVTLEALRAHVKGFVDGTLTPNLRSEPIPESNDGPVKVVVGKTFDSIVLDDEKDVLVEFYAPWCGHCKSLAPKYEELGKFFEKETNVVIAKIDATANDSPADVQGFPTIILYPAHDKKNPVDYSGDRSISDMAKFIRTNGKAVDKKGPLPSSDEDDDGHDHEHVHGHRHDDHDDL